MDRAETANTERASAVAVPMLEPGFIENFERRYPDTVINTLLKDRTTGRNIKWADVEYQALGDGYEPEDEITLEKISGTNSGVIKPRVLKDQERQSKRTKARAEVFTPSWLVNEMCDALDEGWFGRPHAFDMTAESAPGGGTSSAIR